MKLVPFTLVLVVLGLSVIGRTWGGESPAPETGHAEARMLDKGGMDPDLYGVLLAWCGAPGWQRLDEKWAQQQKEDARYAVLRGLMAEAQGNFSDAGKRYAEGGPGGWPSYHRGRLKAFMGDIAAAKRDLQDAVMKAKDVGTYLAAADGLAEIALLQGDLEQMEKVYLDIWEKRTGFEQRLALLEPLLSVMAERGRSAAWIQKLKAKADAQPKASSAARAELAALVAQAESVSSDDWKVKPELVELLTAPGAEPVAGVFLKRRMSDASESVNAWLDARGASANGPPRMPDFSFVARVFERPAAIGDAPDGVLALILRSKAVGGVDSFREAARMMRARLREKPVLAASACAYLPVADLPEMHRFLSGEIFNDLDSKAWRAFSLWLRAKAGEPPAQLRELAVRVWNEASFGEFDSTSTSMTLRLSSRLPLEFSILRDSTYSMPSAGVVWNLRGAPFTDAMSARFGIRLMDRLRSSTDMLSGRHLVDGDSAEQYLGGAPFDAASGRRLRERLWSFRAALGLDEASVALAVEPPPSKVRVLEQLLGWKKAADAAEVIKGLDFSEETPMALLLALAEKLSLSRWPQKEEPDTAKESRRAALAKVQGAIVREHPFPIVEGLRNPLLAVDVKPLSKPQKDELLLSPIVNGGGMDSEDYAARVNEMWKKIDPMLADERLRSVAGLELKRQMGVVLRPHPLWGLEWKPSLRRDRLLLTLGSQRSPRPFAAKLLEDPVPEGKGGFNQRSSFGSDAFSLSGSYNITWKIFSAGYGADLVRPDPARLGEIRVFATRFPVVQDYLRAWDGLGAEPELGESRRWRGPSPPAGFWKPVIEALQKSSGARARLTLAALWNVAGDATKARELAVSLKGNEGPAGRILDVIDHPPVEAPDPGRQAMTVVREKEAREAAISKVKSLLERPETKADLRYLPQNFVSNNLSGLATQSAVYDWLQGIVKPSEEFAPHVSLLGELARNLKRPADEIAKAEDLDLKLNMDTPQPWLRIGLRYLNEGKSRFAVDMYFEAVRRIDFSQGTTFLWTLKPQKGDWTDLVVQAGRVDEFCMALIGGIEHTPKELALEAAANFAEVVMRKNEVQKQPAMLGRLVESMARSQQHLFLVRFDDFVRIVAGLGRDGQGEMAGKLARVLLQAHWPEQLEKRRDLYFGSSTNGIPTGLWNARSSWGGHDEVKRDGPVEILLGAAMRGDHDDFVKSSVARAREHPSDEWILSGALVCSARAGKLDDGLLHLADGLDDQAKMRVAWRLCEYAPEQSVSLSALAPLLEAGLRAMFRDPHYTNNGSRHFLLAFKITPWLEKAGSAGCLERLLPEFRNGLNEKYLNWVSPGYWHQLASLHARFGHADDVTALAARWRLHLDQQIEKSVSGNWAGQTIRALASSGVAGGKEKGAPFAFLAQDFWQKFCDRFGSEANPDAVATALLGDALLTAGDETRLASFAASLDHVAEFSNDAFFGKVVRRFRAEKAWLDGREVRPPSVRVALDLPRDQGGSPQVHWEFALPAEFAETLKLAREDARDDGEGDHELDLDPVSFPAAGLLKQLSGRHDLEIYAGEERDALRLVGRVEAAASSGMVYPQNMPPSGWVRVMVKDRAAGLMNFGNPAAYSIRPVLLSTKSAALPAQVPKWKADIIQEFGKPLSMPVELNRSAEYLVSVRARPAALRPGFPTDGSVRLVVLDANGQPFAMVPLFQRERSNLDDAIGADDARSWRFRPDESIAARGMLQGRGLGNDPAVPVPSSFVFTTLADRPADFPALDLRLFKEPLAGHAEAKWPELQATPLATLGFQWVGWHISEHLKRAAICGQNVLVVFDTSQIPWRLLARMNSETLTGKEWPLVMSKDEVICMERTIPQRRSAGFRIIKIAEDARYDAAERKAVPFEYWSAELNPSEDGVVFFSDPRLIRTLRAAWMDPAGHFSSVTINRPPPGAGAVPQVAWWGKDGSIVGHEAGVLFHLRKSPEAFILEKTEVRPITRKDLPEGTTPGELLQLDRWSVKSGSLLIERDSQSGGLLRAWRLPVECDGRAVQAGADAPVILFTKGLDLIQVSPRSGK